MQKTLNTSHRVTVLCECLWTTGLIWDSTLLRDLLERYFCYAEKGLAWFLIRLTVITAKADCGAVPTNEAEEPIELERLAERLGVDMVKVKEKGNKRIVQSFGKKTETGKKSR